MAWIELHQTLREHKKMFACADTLNLSRIEMIGTLVSLWLWALDNAQDGSLAGISEKTIARVCDFPEKKAGKLVSALVDHGFIDFDGESYMIHDWYDYAGKLMERREKDRKRKKTSVGKGDAFRRNSNGNPEDIREKSHATVPYRTLPYSTEPILEGGKLEDGCGSAGAATPNDGALFTAFWEAYPDKCARDTAWDAWRKLNPGQDLAAQIMHSLEAWKKSAGWQEQGGKFIPRAAKWLSEGHWQNIPAPASVKHGIPKGASGQLGEAELDAIQIMMANRTMAEEDNNP